MVGPPDVSRIDALSENDASWINSKLSPHPVNTVKTVMKIDETVYNEIRKAYIMFLPNIRNRTKINAESHGWEYHELVSDHWGIVSRAQQVADLLMEISD